MPTLCFLRDAEAGERLPRCCVVEVESARALVPSCSRAVEAGHGRAHAIAAGRCTPAARARAARLVGRSVDGARGRCRGYVRRNYAAAQPGCASGTGTRRRSRSRSRSTTTSTSATTRKCILCYKCVEACGTDAPEHVRDRGRRARLRRARSRPSTAVPLPDSACVYCGNCIGVCPTGALMFKSEHDMREAGTWDESRQTVTDTICPYCGVGCTLDAPRPGRRDRARSPRRSTTSVTEGHLCIKGRFGWRFVE